VERQAAPLSRIVPAFDVIKDVRSRLRPRPVLPPIHSLSFVEAK
jgi:hypothetical protein